MTWAALKVVASVAACALCAYGGYQYAAALYGKDIAELREDYAARAAALEAEYRGKERQGAEAISAAWEERDRAMADAVDLRGDLERVRREGADLRRRLSAAGSDSCDACRAKLAGCVVLLEEGAGLLAEGAGLSQRIAADKDALARLK